MKAKPCDTSPAGPASVDQVNWSEWSFRESAVLCFLREDDRVLLIHKKVGLGAGKINGPGGRIEPGEKAEEAAVREMIEEVGLRPRVLQRRAELSFIFTDGYSLRCTVFLAHGYTGELRESREADPFWCDVDRIPFERMWEDDALWLPRVLGGEELRGYFLFDGDRMTGQRIVRPGGDPGPEDSLS